MHRSELGATLLSARTALRCALIVVGCFCVLRGIGYSPFFGPEMLPRGVELVTAYVPINAWAALWVASGILAFVSIIPCWPGGSLGCMGMCFIWATGYCVSWVMSIGDGVSTPGDRDYLSSSIYWTVLLLLGCGYVLSRKAIDNRGVRSTGTS